MSWTCVAWAKNQRTGNPIRKLVLLGLAECADQEGRCWPSYQYLADIAESSTKSVERHIERLEGMGLIKRTHRLRRGDGRLGAYHYILNIAQARMALGETGNPEDKLSTGQNVGWSGDQPTPVSEPPDTAVSAGPADTGVGAGTDHYGTTKEPASEPAPARASVGASIDWNGWTLNLRHAPDSLTAEAFKEWLNWKVDRDPRWRPSPMVVDQVLRELAKADAKGWFADEALSIWMQAGWSSFRADYLDRLAPAAEAGTAPASGGGMAGTAQRTAERLRRSESERQRRQGDG